MNDIKVFWTVGQVGNDMFADDYQSGEQRFGTLTTNHSASSYGLPVVVGDDGIVYGPAEIGEIRDLEGHTDTAWVDDARGAGYRASAAALSI